MNDRQAVTFPLARNLAARIPFPWGKRNAVETTFVATNIFRLAGDRLRACLHRLGGIIASVLVCSAMVGFAMACCQPPKSNDELTEGIVEELLPNAEKASREPSDANRELPKRDQAKNQPLKGSENPLTEIQQEMQRVSKALMKGEVGAKTLQSQNRILDRLDDLIKAIDESQRSTSSKPDSSKGKEKGSETRSKENSKGQADAPTNPDDPSGKKGGNRGQGIPGDASDGDAQGRIEVFIDPDSERGKGIWGHLPERARKEMQASPITEFLPKYRKWIEGYYLKLNEEERKSR